MPAEPLPQQRSLLQKASVASFLATPVASVGLLAFLYRSPITRRYFRVHVGKLLLAAYLIWAWVLDRNAPRNGGRPSQWARQLWLWRHFREYFPARVIRCRGALNPRQPYVIGLHPHGVWSVGAHANFISDNQSLPGIDYRGMGCARREVSRHSTRLRVLLAACQSPAMVC